MRQSFNADQQEKPQRQKVEFRFALHVGDLVDFVVHPRENHDCDGVYVVDMQLWQVGHPWRRKLSPKPIFLAKLLCFITFNPDLPRRAQTLDKVRETSGLIRPVGSSNMSVPCSPQLGPSSRYMFVTFKAGNILAAAPPVPSSRF